MAPNCHVIQAFISSVQSKFSSTIYGCESNETDHPRTELYLHANMVVHGMNSLIFEITGITCSVNPFSSELGIVDNVTIADRAIAYDFQYSQQT